MKKILITALCLSLTYTAFSQSVQRSIRFRPIEKDSMAIHLDSKYFLIEDSCSTIIRHVRFDPPTRKFKGFFKDVNKQNPSQILSKGFYNDNSKLHGLFEEYYADGKLKAKGMFDEGNMVGTWIIYKEDGSKWIDFEGSVKSGRVLNAWDDKGKQIVKDGNGNYVLRQGEIEWKGKLVNGSPDGTWRSTNLNKVGQALLSQETFSKGKFVKGVISGMTYQNESRINLEPKHLLDALNTENLRVSEEYCDGERMFNNYQHAYFKAGSGQLLETLKSKIGPAIGKFDYAVLNVRKFRIYGVINEKGAVTDLKYIEYLNYAHANELINSINTLPGFIPAKENGVNVKSNIIFEFNTTAGGWYSYNYKFTKYQDFKSIK